MQVVVTFKPTASLDAVVNAISNPTSSEYRQYLSPNAVGAQFGVSSSAYASAVSYFEGFGLTVMPSSTLLSVSVSGTVAQMEGAFHTTMGAFAQQYTSNGVWNPLYGNDSATPGTVVTGPVFYANTAPVTLPQSLAAIISGITGLDAMPAQPNIVMPYGMAPGSFGPGIDASTNTTVSATHASCVGLPYYCTSEINSGVSYTKGNFLWTSCEGVGFSGCSNYQFLFPSTMPYVVGAAQNLWNGASTLMSEPDEGQGITIAVVEVGCAIPSDISAFSLATFGNANQLPDRLTQIGLNDPTGFFSNTNLDGCISNGEFWGWTLETELDIEYAATMAPMAHIDVVATGSADFSSFDNAYAVIAQFLSTMGTCDIPSWAAVILAGPVGGACSISITSNSYGEGEQYEYFYGSPIYLTATDTLLEILNLVGVTNFFASGDGGGTYLTVNDFASASSPGSTSVGGGMVTAAGPDGNPFPVTTKYFYYCTYEFYGYCYGEYAPAYWAPATGLYSYTYWDYGEGLLGTEVGVVGGGFGNSLAEPQEWWQNAFDTYSSGARIDAVVSGSAAFNMTVYAFGAWNFFYGGTSFATPITAGEWALIEEQANVALGNPKEGDINPILFAAHNANEAGVSSVPTDPYAVMQNIGFGFDWGPINSFTWYYYNLSIENPTAPTQPSWFATLFNPAGSGWNYLQGLGMPMEPMLDNALFGQTGVPGHSLGLPAFSILENDGALVPFTTLVGGMTYSLQIEPAGVYNVVMYSGGPDDGTYAGGVWTTFQTGADGSFSYTPITGAAPGGAGATTYGYFLVTSVVGGSGAAWAFSPFAVAAPTPDGTLSLCVVDTYGICQTSIAEVPMFTTQQVGYYNLFGQAQVTLNGLPVPNAEVWQTSVQSQFYLADPTVPPAYYAPGMTIGHTLTDFRGGAQFWPAPLGLAEVNGTLLTQIYILCATYDGLSSNCVTVFVEPQAGSFFTGNLQFVSGDGQDAQLVGTLQAADMKDLDFLNISVGSSPGEYQNWTCPLPGAFEGVYYGFSQPPNTMPFPAPPMTCQPYYDSNPIAQYQYPWYQWNPGIWTSGFDNVQVSVDLSLPSSGPVVVSILGGGTNDLSFIEQFCEYGECFSFIQPSIQYPMYWQDPLVYLPTHLSASATGSVTGTDTFTYSGTAYAGAVGELELISATGTQVLATGMSGSYALNTANLADGSYQVVFTEVNTAGASVELSSATIYAANTQASLTQTIGELQGELNSATTTITSLNAQITSDAATISSLTSQVASLQASLASANANIASLSSQLQSAQATISTLQSQVASLTSQVSTLQGNLAAAQATVASLNAQIASLEQQGSASASEIASLQSELATANATIASDQTALANANSQLSADQTQISSLNAQVAQLQKELNAKKNYIAPAWYDTSLGGALILLFAGLGVAVGIGGTWAAMRRRRSASSDADGSAATPGSPARTSVVAVPASAGGPKPEDVIRRAMAARSVLIRQGDFESAEYLGLSAKLLGEMAGVPASPEGHESMYR